MPVNRDTVKNYNMQGGELFAKQVGETNYQYLGATNAFKLSFKTDMIEHENSETNVLVTDLEVIKKVEASLSFDTEDLNPTVLALAFGGDALEVTQVAGTGSSIAFSAVVAKSVYELGKHKVSNVVVTTSQTIDNSKNFTAVEANADYDLEAVEASNVVVGYNDGVDDVNATLDTDYTLNDGVITIIDNGVLAGKDVVVSFTTTTVTNAILDVDYSLNPTFGTIEIADSGALVGKDITVTFDNEAETIVNYTALNNTSREFSLRFVSNPANGQAKQTTVHKCRLSLNGDYDLKSLDKFTSLSFTGKVLLDSSKAEGKQFVETLQVGA